MRPFSFILISVSIGIPRLSVFFRYRFNFLLANNEVTVSDITPTSSWGSQSPSGPPSE